MISPKRYLPLGVSTQRVFSFAHKSTSRNPPSKNALISIFYKPKTKKDRRWVLAKVLAPTSTPQSGKSMLEGRENEEVLELSKPTHAVA